MQDIFKFLSAYNDQVGDSMDINELAIIYEISWDDVTHANCTPFIYVNGNFITGQSQYVSINQRQYHYDLKEMYTTNMQYHKNDIIKKPLSYWKNCQLDQLITERKIEFSYGMYKYNVVIICPIEKHDVIPQTMKLFPGYKIYLV